MSKTRYLLQNEAQNAFFNQLREDAPETHRSFIKNVKRLRKLYQRFKREICSNCKYSTREQKKEYLYSLKVELEALLLGFDRFALDGLLKSHGETFDNFPDVQSEELRAVLSIDCSAIWADDTPAEEVCRLRGIKKQQETCLQAYYYLKVQKALEFILKPDEKKLENLMNSEATDFKSIKCFTRSSEIEFHDLLEKNLEAFDPESTFLKPAERVLMEKNCLLHRLAQIHRSLAIEIDNNLLLLQRPEAQLYLQRLLQDLEKFTGPEFLELPGKQKKKRSGLRTDILAARQELDQAKTTVAGFIHERCMERLGLYNGLSGSETQDSRGVSNKEFIAALKEIGFFDLPVISKASDIKNAAFLHWLTGRSRQRLRVAIGKRMWITKEERRAVEVGLKNFFGRFSLSNT